MFKQILLALDGSPQCERVSALAGTLALSGDLSGGRSSLHLVCAVDAAYVLDSDDPEARGDFPAAAAQQTDAQALIAAQLAHLRGLGLVASGAVLAGEPAAAICDEAARRNCDLIVIGHRHLSRLGRLFDPSIGARVLDAAPCPVLVEVRDA
ncbi:universal stress protein [Pseudomonas sp. RIT-PI-AD]|uniref:universal stress protein n=1 Tax=Pseudomonas sp. RIT-PI-AD TaxID=3035294 RepID=UPI0021DA764F|nr:universal stress protein [Pseudomonas sp. RIT-PI-AD]